MFDPKVYNLDAPFFRELEGGRSVNVGGIDGSADVNRAIVNLMFLKREVRLAARGIKPYRGWSVWNVCKYLGVGRKNSKQLVGIIDDMWAILHQPDID